MTELRQRMIDDMRIRNFSPHTIEQYVRRVRDFARHFGKSPEELGLNEIREFQVYLVNKPDASTSMLRQTVSALRFLYKKTLKRDWSIDEIPHPRRPHRLPTVLSREEVVALLTAASNLKYRAIMATLYAAGLRASELTALTVADIDGKRMLIRVCEGKGRKDRLVPLSPALLTLLREYWRAYRPKSWLFTPQGRDKPLSRRMVHRIVRQTALAVGLKRSVSPHTLRHSYATHLLESGANVRLIQRLLGHNSLRATETYTHVSNTTLQEAKSPFDALPVAAS